MVFTPDLSVLHRWHNAAPPTVSYRRRPAPSLRWPHGRKVTRTATRPSGPLHDLRTGPGHRRGDTEIGDALVPLTQLIPTPNSCAILSPDISTLAAGSRRTAVGSLVGGECGRAIPGPARRSSSHSKDDHVRAARNPIACGETCLAYLTNHEASLAACRSLSQPQAQAMRRFYTPVFGEFMKPGQSPQRTQFGA